MALEQRPRPDQHGRTTAEHKAIAQTRSSGGFMKMGGVSQIGWFIIYRTIIEHPIKRKGLGGTRFLETSKLVDQHILLQMLTSEIEVLTCCNFVFRQSQLG